MEETLGMRIRRLRAEAGFTIHHLAVALLVPPETIQRLEQDDFRDVPRGWMAKIAALTGCETKDVVSQTSVHYYDPSRQVYVLNEESQ